LNIIKLQEQDGYAEDEKCLINEYKEYREECKNCQVPLNVEEGPSKEAAVLKYIKVRNDQHASP
jgi:hypothetical protein